MEEVTPAPIGLVIRVWNKLIKVSVKSGDISIYLETRDVSYMRILNTEVVMIKTRYELITSLILCLAFSLTGTAQGQQTGATKPEAKISDARLEPTPIHSLDRALNLARSGLRDCRTGVEDYTAILVKRERIDAGLSQPEFAKLKVLNR